MVELERSHQYPIISELSLEDIKIITPYLSECLYEDGTVILRHGQVSAQFHIIIEGLLNVYLEKETKVSVAKLSPGQFFGEMSCLTGDAVSATVEAIGRVRTISMSREGMLQLMDKSSSFRSHMIEAMVKRISVSNDRVAEENTRSYAVLRELELERQTHYGKLVGESQFMQRLRANIRRLAQQNEPLCIIGEKGVGKSHIAYEIHRQSSRSDYPMLSVIGDENIRNEWEYKLRAAKGGTILLEQADELPTGYLLELMDSAVREETRLMMTARTSLKTKIQELTVPPLRERGEDIPLLTYEFLSQAGAMDPQEAISQEAMNMIGNFPYLGGNIQELRRVVQDALALSNGKVIRNSHLRFGSVREPGSRPRIGLALGSGSVRGAAHVGVLKVLEQENIPVDIIAGTSVGAFIGALYAGGQPISAFERVLPTVRWRQLVQFTMPPKAFVSNHPMARFVEKYIGPVDFEDLPIDFAAVASDAVSGEACILNKGRVSHAICATTAIPGFMKPVRYQDRLLVDGAVVHPVPVALTKSMGADIVIAVDVSVAPFVKRQAKNFVASILNIIDIMSGKIVQEELQLADIVLHPQLDTHQLTFKSSLDFIRAGEKVTREAVAALKNEINAAMGV